MRKSSEFGATDDTSSVPLQTVNHLTQEKWTLAMAEKLSDIGDPSESSSPNKGKSVISGTVPNFQ